MQIQITDFLKLEQNQMLGYGSFSQVYRVLNKKDKKVYAMKQIDLNKLSQKDQKKMQIEIELHKKINHPYIIKFYDSFQQSHMLFNILEYASNGCLFYYINSKHGFNEALALRFVYQVSQGIKYLHDNDIVHRDIKPENILLDQNFNVKLCDFGCSCILEDNSQRTSICGTYCYMPPEIANEQGHSNSVDIWCLGILLYELLHGKPPFEVTNFDQIKQKIQTDFIQIKTNLNPLVKDLMQNLLKKDAQKRLKIDQVLQHKAFKIYDLEKPLKEQEIQHIIDVYMSKTHSPNMLPPDSIMDKILYQNQPKLTKYFDDIYTPEVRKSIQTLNQINDFFNTQNDTKIDYQHFDINFFDVLDQQENQSNKLVNDFQPQEIQMTQKIEQQDDFFDMKFTIQKFKQSFRIEDKNQKKSNPQIVELKQINQKQFKNSFKKKQSSFQNDQQIQKESLKTLKAFNSDKNAKNFYQNKKQVSQFNLSKFNNQQNQIPSDNIFQINNLGFQQNPLKQQIARQISYNHRSNNQPQIQPEKILHKNYSQKTLLNYDLKNPIQSTRIIKAINKNDWDKKQNFIKHNSQFKQFQFQQSLYMGNKICKTENEQPEDVILEPTLAPYQPPITVQNNLNAPIEQTYQNFENLKDQSIYDFMSKELKSKIDDIEYKTPELQEIENKIKEFPNFYKINDCYYEGNLEGQSKEGIGRQVKKNGDYYEGNFKNNQFDGYGRFINKKLDVYEGQFKEGKFNGKGKLDIQSEGVYEGQFVNGLREGKGCQLWNDGSEYKGTFLKDLKHGQGELRLVNGSKYHGGFENDQFEGQGTFEWISGKKYTGFFHKNMMHGKGFFIWPNGQKYDGEYKDNQKHGFGKMEYPNGLVFEGNFKNGQKDGEGTLTDQNGEKKRVKYQNGKAIELLNQLINSIICYYFSMQNCTHSCFTFKLNSQFGKAFISPNSAPAILNFEKGFFYCQIVTYNLYCMVINQSARCFYVNNTFFIIQKRKIDSNGRVNRSTFNCFNKIFILSFYNFIFFQKSFFRLIKIFAFLIISCVGIFLFTYCSSFFQKPCNFQVVFSTLTSQNRIGRKLSSTINYILWGKYFRLVSRIINNRINT